MSDQIEAIGGLAMGGLAARELDRAGASRHGHGHDHELTECQNCGAHLAGAYCHQCGQSGHVHRTLGHVFEEFAHGILHVDGKVWRTLPMLVLNPGRLTRDYTHGKRVRYIAPFALFLFMVFLTFLIFGFIGGVDINPNALAKTSVAEAVGDLAGAEADLSAARRDPDATPAEIAIAEAAVTKARAAVEKAKQQAKDTGEIVKPGQSWTEVLQEQARAGKLQVNFQNEDLNARARHALENIDLVLYKIQQKAYKLSFLLVPMSLPVMWLLFAWRRNITLYDHTVFILYSLSFMLLLGCVGALLGSFAPRAIRDGLAWLLLVPPVHMYVQLKGAYGLGTRSALWRTFVLVNAAFLVLAFYVTLMIAIGVVD